MSAFPRRPSRLIKRKYAMPYCVVCLARCGLSHTEVDQKLGFRGAVIAARAKYGSGLIPLRRLGGDHSTTRGGCATSCGEINHLTGFVEQNSLNYRVPDLVAEVDYAFKHMTRRLISPRRLQRLFPESDITQLT